jgi:virulence-associated protein VagC
MTLREIEEPSLNSNAIRVPANLKLKLLKVRQDRQGGARVIEAALTL